MKRYVQLAMQSGRQVFPIAEHVAYSYVVELRDDITSSATSAQSFFEALNLAAALLGLTRWATNASKVWVKRWQGAVKQCNKQKL